MMPCYHLFLISEIEENQSFGPDPFSSRAQTREPGAKQKFTNSCSDEHTNPPDMPFYPLFLKSKSRNLKELALIALHLARLCTIGSVDNAPLPSSALHIG
jgi:hypothetical protein